MPIITSQKEPQQDEQLPEEPLISPAEQRQRDRKRRQREMLFAMLAFIVVLILTSVQLDQFKAGDALFMIMFNINFVILIGILVVVLRNGFKLLLERRRRVLGSRLRTRLVLAFLGLSLLPCLLMFLVTTKYVQISMDFWFKDQVETSMETALELTSTMYNNIGLQMVDRGKTVKAEIDAHNLAWGGADMDSLIERKRVEYNAQLAGIYTPQKEKLNWHATQKSNRAWDEAAQAANWEEINKHGSGYILVTAPDQDYTFAFLALDGGEKGHFVQAFGMGKGFRAGIDRIDRGSHEYKALRKVKQPLKLMLYSSLGVLTALIILSAVWFGFRLARELSAPIFALASGTNRIAKGDLSVRLNDSSQDEFGMLIRSFNRMAEDLENSRHETVSAYSLLEEQNQQTARHSKYMETVLNNIAAGVVSFDADGCVSTINHAACEILDLTPEQMLGKRTDDFLPEASAFIAQNSRERFAQRFENRSQHSMTLRIRGEEKRLLVNMVGFSTEGVYQGTVAVFEDVSELERMQRMAAWREVARRIAHEIKNPLTPIKLSAQRLARKFGNQVQDPAFTQSTALIVSQVEHLQSMVQEFSAFAKLPEVHPVPGHIDALLRDITDLFRNSHSNIRWELSLPGELPLIPMDKEALHRAFMNILSNAAEALIAAQTPDPTVWISASLQPDLSLVHVNVADNGPGLNEEERSRLFEPYFSRKIGGTGLGLTIVRSLVSDHRGYVRATGRDGGGTVISMELPLA